MSTAPVLCLRQCCDRRLEVPSADDLTATAGYPVVEGVENGEELIRAVQPKVVVPLNNSDGSYEGAIAGAITSVGSNEQAAVQAWIEKLGFSGIEVIAPAMPGEPVTISI